MGLPDRRRRDEIEIVDTGWVVDQRHPGAPELWDRPTPPARSPAPPPPLSGPPPHLGPKTTVLWLVLRWFTGPKLALICVTTVLVFGVQACRAVEVAKAENESARFAGAAASTFWLMVIVVGLVVGLSRAARR